MHSSQLLTLSVKHEGSGASSMEYVVTVFSRGSRYVRLDIKKVMSICSSRSVTIYSTVLPLH